MKRKKGRLKQIISFFLGLFMMVTIMDVIPVQAAIISGNKLEKVYVEDGYEITYKVTSQWDNNFNGEITLKNTSDKPIENWGLQFGMKNEITSIWNGTIKSSENGVCIIKNAEFNQDVAPGEKVSIGFTANGKITEVPEKLYLLGNVVNAKSDEYTVKYDVESDWGTGFNGKITITNISKTIIEDWSLEFDLDNELTNIWNASIGKKEGQHYIIKNATYTQNIKAGESISFGFTVNLGNAKNEMSNILLKKIVVEQRQKVIDSLESDFKALSIGYYAGDSASAVTHNITLPNSCGNGSSVEWSSTDESLIDLNGKVSRPTDESKNAKLTARLTLEGKTLVKEFDLNVICIKNIDTSKIKDLSIDDLAERNKYYKNYDVEVNQFGYISHVYGEYSDIKIDSYESALYSLYSLKTAMGINDPFKELEAFSTNVDDTGSIYKFHQMYKGIPVYNAEVVISADSEGNTDYFLSDYFPINKEINTTPTKTYEEAMEYVKETYNKANVYGEDNEKNRLYISNYYGKVELVWKVYFDLLEDENGLNKGEYEVLVSAVNGEIIYVNCTAQYSSNIEVSGNDLNDNEREFTIRENTHWFKDKDYTLEDKNRNIFIYDAEGNADKTSGKDIYKIYEQDGWTAEQVSAMANMNDVYDFYYNTFDRISYDNAWWQWSGNDVDMYLNTGINDNAYWSGNKKIIAVGVGTQQGGVFENISLAAGEDILCHEFTHAVIGNETSLDKIYYGTPGAINEAYADIFACFNDENWRIGEDVSWGQGIRDIANPNSQRSPSSVGGDFYVDYKNDTQDRAGVHINSTIISHAAYLMQQNGISLEDTQKLWYKSLCLGYSKHSDFYDVRLNVLQAANKLSFTDEKIKIINEAFDTVNILQSNCDETDDSYYNELDKITITGDYFPDGIQLNGKVVTADSDTILGNNKSLEGVEITVNSFDGSNKYGDTKTDISGAYSPKIKIDNKYLLEYEKEGYISTKMYLDNINAMFQSQYYCGTVELIPRANEGIGAASGKIVSASTNKGVEGLTLNVRNGINNIYTDIIKTIKTSDEGNYVIDSLEAGNYCLEIVDNSGSDSPYISTYMNIKVLGNTSINNQNGVVSSSLNSNQIRVVLSWGSMPRDLDSHMLCDLSDSSKGHVYYGNKEFYNNDLVCMLDVDDVTGYGPETTTIYNNQAGIYTFYVYNYSGESNMDISDATVSIYMNGEAYPAYTFNIPKGDGRYWTVFRYNGATKTVTPIDIVGSNVVN